MKKFFVCTILCLLVCTTVTAADKLPVAQYPFDLAANGITIPGTKDLELNRILYSKNTVFYKLPMAYQQYLAINSEYNGWFFSTYLGDFNANPLFPWEGTLGLNQAKKDGMEIYDTVNFYNLPDKDKVGTPDPIKVLSKEIPVKWIFPKGTTVGEVLYVKHGKENYVQEIRTRKKVLENDDIFTWEPGLYRTVANKQEYITLTGINPKYRWAKRNIYFRNPQEDYVMEVKGMIDRLPPATDDMVKYLLHRPFKNVINTDEAAWSPGADQDFHILPKNYNFSPLGGVDAGVCSDCHRQTQIRVQHLTPLEPLVINNPYKLGNIRGCDAVFTWYPQHQSGIQKDKSKDRKDIPGLVLRQYDIDHGFVVEVKDSSVNDEPKKYRLTGFVQDSLKGDELPNKAFLHK